MCNALNNRVRAILPNGGSVKRIVRRFNLERAARRNISRYLDIRACRLAVGFQRRGKRDNEARDRLRERQRPDGAIPRAVGRRNRDRVLCVRKRREGVSGNGKRLRCAQRDFRAAIVDYNEAIERDPEFAEAYYNRGLARLSQGDVNRGIADLSKAGELGIYNAYSIIKRMTSR